MKNLLASLKKYVLLQGLFYLLFGIIIVMRPGATMNIFIKVIAGYFLVMGLISIVRGLKYKEEVLYSRMSLMGGVLYLIIAGAAVLFMRTLIGLLPILLGIFIIVSGINKWVYLNQFHMAEKRSYIYIGIMVALGIILLFNPFGAVLVAFRIFGVILIVMGIAELWNYVTYR
ncbi:DUF308 domain-containing protein [Vagococcus elongatus]|nr:DUF308 domain-containing protein [Vagococcus elongatus]